MPEQDCFLRYRMHCNAEFYYVGNIPRTGIGYWYWAPVAEATRGFEASKHIVAGQCALPSALLVEH